MAKLRFLSVALIAAAVLATPAMARESSVTSRHLAEDGNASATPGARHIGGGDGFRGNHFGGGFGVISGDRYGGWQDHSRRCVCGAPGEGGRGGGGRFSTNQLAPEATGLKAKRPK